MILLVSNYSCGIDRIAPYQQILWSHTYTAIKNRILASLAPYGRAVTLNANELTGKNMTNKHADLSSAVFDICHSK